MDRAMRRAQDLLCAEVLSLCDKWGDGPHTRSGSALHKILKTRNLRFPSRETEEILPSRGRARGDRGWWGSGIRRCR